jgi:hypothetical protein
MFVRGQSEEAASSVKTGLEFRYGGREACNKSCIEQAVPGRGYETKVQKEPFA